MKVFGLFSYVELVMLGQTRAACERFRDERIERFRGLVHDDAGAVADYAKQFTIDEIEVLA